jgi:uncharacterized protein YbaR (Trm112 family)
VPVDKELMEILACPSCRGKVELRQEGDAEWIVCLNCGLRYPVRDGLPVMLVEEAKSS